MRTATRRTRVGRRVLVLATSVAALALAVPSVWARAGELGRGAQVLSSASVSLADVATAPTLTGRAHAVGAVALTATESGAVALRLPDPAAVTRFIALASDPRAPQFGHYLARGQFTSRFGPAPSTIAAVSQQLTDHGLSVTGVSANHLLVTFDGSAAAVERTFHTGLARVALANHAVGQATTGPIELPGAIAADVQAVVGLDRLVRESSGSVLSGAERRSAARGDGTSSDATSGFGGPVACKAAASQAAEGGLTDQQVARAYGIDPLYGAGDLAKDQTIDVYELEPFLKSDLEAFNKCYFGSSHASQLTVTAVDGGPGSGPGSGEAALDVEDVSALAPSAKIHVFSGPNMGDPFGPLDTWNAIAVADDARQVTASWGICETLLQEGAPGVLQVENEIFEQTAAQGQTVFSAAGDDGSDDCAGHSSTPVGADLSVDDPGSQPYVTSVGGTTMLNPTNPPVETVWNNGASGGGGGGGISEAWAMPSWQTAVAVAQTASTEPCSNDPSGTADNFHVQGVGTLLASGTRCREVPDVSAVADPQSGITIEYDGFWTPIGGTSSSTPLWAAMLAEINGSRGCSGLADGVGFADPLMYQIAASSPSAYSQAFNDVTAGNNDNLGVGSAVDWEAGKGYDLASGLGTPRLTDRDGAPGLASQLCTLAADTGATAPVVTSLGVTAGGPAGGGTETIDGTNFGSTTGSVFFGNVAATVLSWHPTQVSVTIPAYSAPEGTPSGTAGSADVIVVTSEPSPLSSAPGVNSTYHYLGSSAGKPVVDYVSATTGPAVGGGDVTVVGSGFDGATSVHFGTALATIVASSSNSDDELLVKVPASNGTCAVSSSQGMCAVVVSVTTPGGTSSGPTILPAFQGPITYAADGSFAAPTGCGCEVVPAPEEYDYAPTPTITSITPTYTSDFGGEVTVQGTGFNLLDFEWANVGTAGVNLNQDFSVVGVTPTSLDLDVPGGFANTQPASVPFSVQTGGGLSAVSKLTYAGVPELLSISKHVAAQADPGTLRVTGSGLIDVTSMVLQLQGLYSYLLSTSTTITDQTDTSLTVTIPQGFSAPADVLLCSASGCTSPEPSIDTLTLTYPGRPDVAASSPRSGPAHGTTTVTIDGTLDSEVTAVDFGSARATIVSQPMGTPSGPIVVLAPAGKAGTVVYVTISTLGGTIASPPSPRSAKTPMATYRYAASTPTAPRDVSAKAVVDGAKVHWKAPANDGGRPVTGYLVVASAPGHKSVAHRYGATTRRVTVDGLAAHVRWTITVRAKNAFGAGLAATAGPVTAK